MEYINKAVNLILSGNSELLQIIYTTLIMSFFSTVLSSVIGIPSGIVLGKNNFRGKRIILRLINTMMSLPPVVAGLIVFMLFRSVGPFGNFHLMFSVPVMVIAQIVLITPAIISMSASSVGTKINDIKETLHGINITKGLKYRKIILGEFSSQFVSIILMGFGRSIAEVGAVSLVGGNIQYKTRVMTTAILLEANKGDFSKALALGIILMIISLAVNLIAGTLGDKIK